MTVTPLKPVPSGDKFRREDDPLRSELAAAMERLASAQDAVENHRASVQTARAGLLAAKRKLEAAKSAASSAVDEHAVRIAEAASRGEPVPSAGTTRAARDAEQDAADEVAAMEAALQLLKANLPAWQAAADEEAANVERAISAVLVPAARRLVAKAEELRCQLDPLMVALMSLFADGNFAKRGEEPLEEVRTEAALFFARLKKQASAVTAVDGEPWRAHRLALRADPFAPLRDFF